MSHVIPKREVTVRIRLQSGEVVSGQMFLDFIDAVHRGEQTLFDKVNDDFQWFPLRNGDGGTDIINRNQVVLVEPGADLPEGLVRKDSNAVFRRESVAVRIGASDTVHGRIAMDLPDEFCRVSDFLNFPQDFFALETDSGPVLISKLHVTSLRALEAPPAMPGLQDTTVGERD